MINLCLVSKINIEYLRRNHNSVDTLVSTSRGKEWVFPCPLFSFLHCLVSWLHLVLEVRTRLEGRNLMLRDHHYCVPGYISCSLFLSGLHFECAESLEVDVLLLSKCILDCSMNPSRKAITVVASIPVLFATSFTISAFVIICICLWMIRQG